MSLHKLLEEVKKALRPDETIIGVRDQVLAKINEELEKRNLDAEAVPGGSVAKNTYLMGDHDIDIFVRFSMTFANSYEDISDILEQVLKNFKPERIHGSRDYFQFKHEEFDFEVVPVLAVEDHTQAENVTDMSPLHVEYFIGRNEELEDEIRLAKQFCKAGAIYGAESYIRGLSGHVIDLLIMHYKTFYDLVKNVTKWKAPVVIDLEKHHRDPLSGIDASKKSPLVMIDPVQPNRNAAAALSQEKFDEFVTRCKEFIKDPSASFFVASVFSEENLVNELKTHPGGITLVRIGKVHTKKKDIAGAKIRKAFERMKSSYEREGFTLEEDGWHFDHEGDSLFWFVTNEHSLPRLATRRGPPVANEKDAANFRNTHEGVKEKDGFLYAKVEREITKPEQVPESLGEDIKTSLEVEIKEVKALGEE